MTWWFQGEKGFRETNVSVDFMSCRVDLGVMPHSATSRASGDDTSTNIGWNSGVYNIQPSMCVCLL